MKLKKMHWIGMIASALVIAGDLVFFFNEERLFLFLIGLAFGIGALPFIINLTLENKKESKINEMFLEFSRNLAETVATGTPVSKAIINMKNKNYEALSPHIKKLASQIEIGVPIDKALSTFADDVDSRVVRRATSLINEAEKSGGEINYILDSTAKSISEVEKLREERRSAIYNLVVQGYIIFFVFIGIILIMEFKIIPLTENIAGFGSFGGGGISRIEDLTNMAGGTAGNVQDFRTPLLYLLLSQGFFMGLVIGKLTVGSLKSGVKHSLILMISAFLISGGARLFFTPS